MPKRPRRGFVMVELPRHVISKRLVSGKLAFYYNVPSKYRKMNCPVPSEPLGTHYSRMEARAAVLNGRFDEWDQVLKGKPVTAAAITPKFGTVRWLFREYKISKALLRRSLSARAAITNGQWIRFATSARAADKTSSSSVS